MPEAPSKIEQGIRIKQGEGGTIISCEYPEKGTGVFPQIDWKLTIVITSEASFLRTPMLPFKGEISTGLRWSLFGIFFF